MTEAASAGIVRDVVREVLGELLPEMLAATLEARLSTSPEAAAETEVEGTPRVPAPPVAAVHRPSTWNANASQADRRTALSPPDVDRSPSADVAVEEVSIRTDADLDQLVRRILRLSQNPRDRHALASGRLRFALRAGPAASGVDARSRGVVRIDRGAVTEKVVDEAASSCSRLVLGRGAVLTPMGRDRARKLGIEIEREARC